MSVPFLGTKHFLPEILDANIRALPPIPSSLGPSPGLHDRDQQMATCPGGAGLANWSRGRLGVKGFMEAGGRGCPARGGADWDAQQKPDSTVDTKTLAGCPSSPLPSARMCWNSSSRGAEGDGRCLFGCDALVLQRAGSPSGCLRPLSWVSCLARYQRRASSLHPPGAS